MSLIPFALIHHKRDELTFFVFLEIFGISVLKYSCTILKNFEAFQLTLSISILFHEVTQKLVLKMGLVEKLSAILSQQLTPLFLMVDFFYQESLF